MNNPIKIIHKYKNNNRYVQYNINIYIGNVDPNILKILNSFKELPFIEMLQAIDTGDYNTLEKFYGSNTWYNFFFNIHHIISSIGIVRDNVQLQKSLITKFGDDWYNLHINKSLKFL